MKAYFIILYLFIGSAFLNAQTKVQGILKDENNKPLAFADIKFNNSSVGTTSDIKGNFLLKSGANYSKLTISFIGYETQTIELSTKISLDLKIIMKAETNSLREVVLVGKPKKRLKKQNNPAYAILKKIWVNKKKNGLKLAKSYEYEKYKTIELGYDNMDSLFVKKALKKDFNSLSSAIKKNTDNGQYYIPIEFIETSEKVSGDNVLNKQLVEVLGQRKIGIEQEGKIFEKIESAFHDIDVYDNDFLVLNKSFVSPISTEGFGTYDYVLQDSTMVDNKKQYSISFFPRIESDFAFVGNFTVSVQNYALVDITMRTKKQLNLNFVRNFEVEKTFTMQNDSIYLPEKNTYKGDFTLVTKDENEVGIYVVNKEIFNNYSFNTGKPLSFYENQVVQIDADQFKKEDQFWQKKQDKETADVYKLVDKVKDSRKIKALTETLYVLSDGYFNVFKGLQSGSVWTTIAKNDIEGLRLRAGFRTFTTNNDLFRLEGFGAYGLKDHIYKYGLEARYLLAENPRIVISAAYMKDNEQMGLTTFDGIHLLPEADKGSKAVFVRGNNFFLSKIQKSMFRVDIEPAKNLHVGITATHNVIVSGAPTRFSLDYLDTTTNQIKSKTTDVTTDLYMSYFPGRLTAGYGVDEKIDSKLHPTLLLNYRKGYKNILGGDFNYNRLQVLYNYPISLGKFGVFNATVDAGKTFEAVPLSILTAVSSNQTYFLLPNTFALLDYYDFVADTYIEGHFEHHFNGLILNRIPLINKLKMRSLLTFRGVYGTISDGSKAINQSSIMYAAPSKKPYYEYGFGFENIGFGNVRPFRVDFIWRSDFQNVNGPISPKFGIRVGINTTF